MRTTRVLYDSDESSESIARRIVYAFNPGNVFKVRDKFFRVSGPKSVYPISSDMVKEDNYTLVLPLEPNVLPISPQPAVEVASAPQVVEPAPDTKPETPHAKTEKGSQVTSEKKSVKDAKVKVGQRWRAKDTVDPTPSPSQK